MNWHHNECLGDGACQNAPASTAESPRAFHKARVFPGTRLHLLGLSPKQTAIRTTRCATGLVRDEPLPDGVRLMTNGELDGARSPRSPTVRITPNGDQPSPASSGVYFFGDGAAGPAEAFCDSIRAAIPPYKRLRGLAESTRRQETRTWNSGLMMRQELLRCWITHL